MIVLARLLWVLAGETDSFHHWLGFRLRIGPLLPLIAASEPEAAEMLQERLAEIGRKHLRAEGCVVFFPTAPAPVALAEAGAPVMLSAEEA